MNRRDAAVAAAAEAATSAARFARGNSMTLMEPGLADTQEICDRLLRGIRSMQGINADVVFLVKQLDIDPDRRDGAHSGLERNGHTLADLDETCDRARRAAKHTLARAAAFAEVAAAPFFRAVAVQNARELRDALDAAHVASASFAGSEAGAEDVARAAALARHLSGISGDLGDIFTALRVKARRDFEHPLPGWSPKLWSTQATAVEEHLATATAQCAKAQRSFISAANFLSE